MSIPHDRLAVSFYHTLCRDADSLLRTRALISLPILHVRRGHPDNLASYRFLAPSSFLSKSLIYLGLLKEIAYSFTTQITRILVSFLRSPETLLSSPVEPTKVLIVSHLYNANQLRSNSDPFYGSIPHTLDQSRLSTKVLLINHPNVPLTQISALPPVHELYSVLPFHLNYRRELEILLQAILLFYRLLRTPVSTASQYHLKILALHSCLTRETFVSLRTGLALKYALAKYRPLNVISTWEGHAWERILCADTHALLPRSRFLAFQHAPLLPLQHASLRGLADPYNPDKVLLSYPQYFNTFLRSSLPLNTTDISIVGSPHPLFKRSKSSSPTQPTFLLVPEGTKAESGFFLSFAIQASSKYPQASFILRLHPLISLKTFLRSTSEHPSLPGNLIFSDSQKLEDDILRSTAVIYRASSAAVKAVDLGLDPFYLSSGELHSIDILQPLSVPSTVVSGPLDLLPYISRFQRTSSNRSRNHQCVFPLYESNLLLSLLTDP